MSWLGTWRNQYDSVVTITDEADGRIAGTFRTAINSSPFAGADVPIAGVHSGATISFASATSTGSGAVVSYTGKLEKGKLETIWLVVSGDKDWWTSVITNHDTFVRDIPNAR